MKKYSDITKAVVAQLESDAALLSINPTIKRGEYINELPRLCPWIGVYKGSVSMKPGALGRSASTFDSTIPAKIVVQASHGNSGAECEERLDEYVKLVLDALWSDPTIGGTVGLIRGFDIEYTYRETESETLYFQWAIINVECHVRTG